MVAAVLGMVLITPSAQAQTPEVTPLSAAVEQVGAGDWFWKDIAGTGSRDACQSLYVCIFDTPGFWGSGRRFHGNVVPGDCVSWFGTVWSDDVESAVNKGTAYVTFYDIHGPDWIPIGSLYPGYDFSSGWPGAHKVNGMCAYEL